MKLGLELRLGIEGFVLGLGLRLGLRIPSAPRVPQAVVPESPAEQSQCPVPCLAAGVDPNNIINLRFHLSMLLVYIY